jgi:hypothetical protein
MELSPRKSYNYQYILTDSDYAFADVFDAKESHNYHLFIPVVPNKTVRCSSWMSSFTAADAKNWTMDTEQYYDYEIITDSIGRRWYKIYVNDSKGTNPDSTIKAVQSYNKPIILIAGGYDKNSNYDELLETCKTNVYALVLLGQTAQKIYDCAKNKGFNNINIAKDMEEAVQFSYKLAKDGDVVLLSPACASWDMYKSFEVRGIDFKDNVNNLK